MARDTKRQGLTAIELFKLFPDDETAKKWFIKKRWDNGTTCPFCHSKYISDRIKPQPYRCKNCLKDFSVRTGTLMQDSKIDFQKWVISIYLITTNLKGISSYKLAREIGVTQKTAWFMAMRIRETWQDNKIMLSGEVEIDETFIGGKEKTSLSIKESDQ